ncbi:MAG: hypothetical protein EOO77_12215 [Oxalobacteraceae bacterium]|nr:MAG: hypothetical protein EOO77_12215 [Oxalobacteraceae bacterium]
MKSHRCCRTERRMTLGIESDKPVTFNGLQSGLDSDAIVAAAVKVAEQPIRHLERKQAILVAHSETYGQISTLMQGMQATLQQMASHSTFSHLSVASSDVSVVNATSGAGAALNSHRIQVQALATVQRTYSDPVEQASDSGTLGAGTLKITALGEKTLQVPVDAETRLTDVANAINEGGIAAQAAIIFDGSAYRLQVTGTESGTRRALRFEDDGLRLNLSRDSNTPQAAQDARFVLDDFSTITRPTNVVGDVITGITLQLNAVSPDTQTLQTHVDAGSIVANVEQFVDGYNALKKAIVQATHYEGYTDHAKSVGDVTLITLNRTLQATVGESIAGLEGEAKALSQVGISSQKDESLKLDTRVLRSAIDRDPRQVARLFVFDPTSQTRGVAYKMQKLVGQYTTVGTGILAVRIDSLNHRSEAMHEQIGKVQANVKKYESTLKDRYTTLEKKMAQIKSQNNYLDALKPQQQKR